MKKTIIIKIMFILAIAGNSRAQDTTKTFPFVYAELGLGDGNFFDANVALNIIFLHTNMITIGYQYYDRTAPNLPGDYTAGGGFLSPNGNPQQTASMFELMYGKVIYAKRSTVRVVLRGGLTAGVVSSPTNFVYTGSSFNSYTGSWSSNYTNSLENQLTIGLILNPTLELPVSRIFGFSIGLYGNINTVMIAYGGDANIIFGRLRNKRGNKNHRGSK